MTAQLANLPPDYHHAHACPHAFAGWVTRGARRPYAWTNWLGTQVAFWIVRGNGRLIVNVPPQHGKSKFISEIVPTWFLWRWPEKHVIITSYGAELAYRSGRECRNIIRDAQLPGLSLREDSTAAHRWNTSVGGGLIAAGVGGGVTGNPGHLIIVDDPYKNWSDAQSKLMRSKVQDWFENTLYQRQQQDTTFIVLTTRWHRDDLCGYLSREHEDDWRTIRLPAIAGKDDPIGRAEGDALCPERYTREKLLDIRRGLSDEAVWNAVYQQAPDESTAANVYRNFSGEHAPAGNIDRNVQYVPELPLQVSIDYNQNPGMHVEIGQYDLRRDIAWEIHEIHGSRMHLDDAMQRLVKFIGELPTRPKSIELYGDASGQNQGKLAYGEAYQEHVERYLRKLGIPFSVIVPMANPPVVERVSALNNALRDIDGRRSYFIHPACERLIEDMKELRNGPDGKPNKTDLALSHASDAVGYKFHEINGRRAFRFLRPGRAVFQSR